MLVFPYLRSWVLLSTYVNDVTPHTVDKLNIRYTKGLESEMSHSYLVKRILTQ